jgi:spermidine synthase
MLRLPERLVLLLAVLVAGLCSIVYELELSTASSYFLGDSVKQFSLIIGVYMAAMGVGSYLTKYIAEPLIVPFILTEILLGFIGGCSVPLVYFLFDQLSAGAFQALVLGLTFCIGLLTGLEIPLLALILKQYYPLQSNLANVLSLDYIGALIATLLFPFLLLPKLGLFRTGVGIGLANIALGFFMLWYLGAHTDARIRRQLQVAALAVMAGFVGLLYFSKPLLQHWQDSAYAHKVIYARQTPYQHIAVTKKGDDVRLYINRIIQFSAADEYRYHESLALIPMSTAPYRNNVLILGGGEGLLAREVLKYADVAQITIVDLDTAVFELAQTLAPVRAVNGDALRHPKVKMVAQDASVFIRNTEERFDVVLADLPDPSNEAVARLYSRSFFQHIRAILNPYGVVATQATSPFHTNNAFWCIEATIRAAGFEHTRPYHTFVPSFGNWGFIMAANYPLSTDNLRLPTPTRYLDSVVLSRIFYFDKDLRRPENLRVNELDQPALLDYYLKDWSKWSREQSN